MEKKTVNLFYLHFVYFRKPFFHLTMKISNYRIYETDKEDRKLFVKKKKGV